MVAENSIATKTQKHEGSQKAAEKKILVFLSAFVPWWPKIQQPQRHKNTKVHERLLKEIFSVP
jgi:hypothetical protein